MNVDAVLLASFGGPENPDEVMPFLERVTEGRGVPRERLEAVAEHYHALGGKSPINDQNRRLLGALRTEFARRELETSIYWGNRNSAPFFVDALRQMHRDGHRRIVAIATSAYSSYSGCRQYREDLARAVARAGLVDQMTIMKVRPYAHQAGFTEPFAAGVTRALNELAAAGIDVADTHVLFTTHSIPVEQAVTSGPEECRSSQRPGTYEKQHKDAAERVMKEAMANVGTAPNWSLAFQSRSGPPHAPWLTPDVHTAMTELAAHGTTAVIVAPIGFVSDHVEVVWDLDHEAAATAKHLGLDFRRVPTAGTDPAFVTMLTDLVQEIIDNTSPRPEPGSAPLCARGCCPNPRTELPTVIAC